MPTRPKKCYRNADGPAYTQQKYIRGMPSVPSGLSHLSYGNSKADFAGRVKLVVMRDGQISAESLESARVFMVRHLQALNPERYSFRIKVLPFQVNRMHGLVGVAKAERFSKGMRLGFGKTISRGARVKKGTVIMEALIPDEAFSFQVTRQAFVGVTKKLSFQYKIEHEGFSAANVQTHVVIPKVTTAKKETK